jgi:hypothetical protein
LRREWSCGGHANPLPDWAGRAAVDPVLVSTETGRLQLQGTALPRLLRRRFSCRCRSAGPAVCGRRRAPWTRRRGSCASGCASGEASGRRRPAGRRCPPSGA